MPMRVLNLLIATLLIGVASSYANERAMIVDHVKNNKEVCDRAKVNVHKNPQYYAGIVKTCNENSRGDSNIQSVFDNIPKELIELMKNNGTLINSSGNRQVYSETDLLTDDPFFDD